VAPLGGDERDHARRRVEVGDDEPAPASLLHLWKWSSHSASAPFHATEQSGGDCCFAQGASVSRLSARLSSWTTCTRLAPTTTATASCGDASASRMPHDALEPRPFAQARPALPFGSASPRGKHKCVERVRAGAAVPTNRPRQSGMGATRLCFPREACSLLAASARAPSSPKRDCTSGRSQICSASLRPRSIAARAGGR
jgi:hypothetical protein